MRNCLILFYSILFVFSGCRQNNASSPKEKHKERGSSSLLPPPVGTSNMNSKNIVTDVKGVKGGKGGKGGFGIVNPSDGMSSGDNGGSGGSGGGEISGGGSGKGIGSFGKDKKNGFEIKSGRAAVIGTLDPRKIRSIIRKHRNEVRYCYKKGLISKEKLAGMVRVSFFIGASGFTTNCGVTKNLSVPVVGTCICHRIKRWKFPKPKDGTAKVTYSWFFKPDN